LIQASQRVKIEDEPKMDTVMVGAIELFMVSKKVIK